MSTDSRTKTGVPQVVVSGARMPVAGLLAWLVPGLGHWYLGHRVRAVVFFVVTTVTFWTGVAVGGVKSTVNYAENGAWIAAQLCMGPQAIGAWGLGQAVTERYRGQSVEKTAEVTAYWPADNIAVVYTGITGLLNLLIIIDALARAELPPQVQSRPPPAAARRVG